MWKRFVRWLVKEEIDEAYNLGLKVGIETGKDLVIKSYELGWHMAQVEIRNNQAIPVIYISEN